MTWEQSSDNTVDIQHSRGRSDCENIQCFTQILSGFKKKSKNTSILKKSKMEIDTKGKF